MPSRLVAPIVDRIPTSALCDAGPRIELPVSVPRPAAPRFAATAAAVVAYFYIGTFFEERRMERKFGEEYREYQKRVPRLFPLPRP